MIAASGINLIKFDKISFDKNIPNYFQIQVNDLLEFLKICPIFYKCSNEILLKLAIRTETKKFNTDKEILGRSNKTENLYIIRSGFVKVFLKRSINL